jgi:hypothetical protein
MRKIALEEMHNSPRESLLRIQESHHTGNNADV